MNILSPSGNTRQRTVQRVFMTFASFCSLAGIALASPSPTTNLLSAAQTLGFEHWAIGPLSFGGSYDSLLGNIFNAQYVKKFNQRWAFGLIGEYGPHQYRFNGTLAAQLTPSLQAKVSSEYLSQVLPFKFDSGNTHQRLGQSAYGFELRQNLSGTIFQNFNLGAYWADAPNKNLPSKIFTQNDLIYTNQRDLAGAISQGLNMGVDLKLTRLTLLKTKLFYDSVNYRTQLTSSANVNRSGGGGALELDQILSDQFKISVDAEKREIYDTYSSELDWQSVLKKSLGIECALLVQHVSSKNPTPSSNSIGLEITLFPDESSKVEAYALDQPKALSGLLPWVKTPAVYMQRVLAVSEQKTTLNGPSIQALSPSNGPVTGGNTTTITGSNFLPGAAVSFGGVAGITTVISPTELSVVVPALSASTQKLSSTRSVDVVETNPNGQEASLSQAYTYTGVNAPSLSSASPNSGNISGGESITLSGTHLNGTSSVTFGGSNASSIVVVNDTEVTVSAPAHAAGTVDIVLTTADGSSSLSGGYTYLAAPTVTSVSPSSGSSLGGSSVTITGSNLTDASAVMFGSQAASSFIVNSSTSITATSPAGSAGTVDITVTTPNGTSTTSSADQFTYTGPAIIFVTSTTYTGNLGGFSGANTKCNSDPGKPGGFAAGYTYKALLQGNNATTNGVTYYRTNGTTVIATATGGNLVGLNSLTNSINTSSSPTAWTGADGASNCSNWSATVAPGMRGDPSQSTSQYWNTGISSCGIARAIYCASQ